MWPLGPTRPAHHDTRLGVVLAEVLQRFPKISPKFRPIHCARLLFLAVRVIQNRSTSGRTRIEVILFLQYVIGADSPLSLVWGFLLPILHIHALILLTCLAVAHLLSRHLVVFFSMVIF